MSSENRPSMLYIALIMGSMVILGLGVYQAELMTNYGGSTDDLTYLDKSSEISDQITDIKDSIETTKVTGIDILDAFIVGVYNTLKLFFGIGDLYTTFITNIAGTMGLPGWAVTGIIVTVFTSIIFGVVSIITKWRS